MRTVLLFAFLASSSFSSVQGGEQSSPAAVTVLLDFEQTHSTAPLSAMRRELQDIMKGAGVQVDVQLKSEAAEHAQFSRLVLFKMKGACTMNALPVGALSDERGPLAMTYTSDGKLLPFGEVECGRVRESVERTLGRGDPEGKQLAYATALARVMAHEMYHMIADSKGHTKDGATRESLSSRELLGRQLPLGNKAEAQVRTGFRQNSLR
jgi:predicted nucleotidyltransferase